jgi:hypothetical protein
MARKTRKARIRRMTMRSAAGKNRRNARRRKRRSIRSTVTMMILMMMLTSVVQGPKSTSERASHPNAAPAAMGANPQATAAEVAAMEKSDVTESSRVMVAAAVVVMEDKRSSMEAAAVMKGNSKDLAVEATTPIALEAMVANRNLLGEGTVSANRALVMVAGRPTAVVDTPSKSLMAQAAIVREVTSTERRGKNMVARAAMAVVVTTAIKEGMTEAPTT